MSVKVFKGDSLIEGASLVLKNRLYVSGWNLSGALKDIKQGKFYYDKSLYALYVKFIAGVPVAVCLATPYSHNKVEFEINVFCKKTHRRKGFASECLALCKKDKGRDALWHFGPGIDGSHVFWQVNDIKKPTYQQLRKNCIELRYGDF